MYPEKKSTWRVTTARKDAPLRMVDHRIHSKDPNPDVILVWGGPSNMAGALL